MIKRLFDIIFSFIGLIVLIPCFFLISLWIILDSKGSVLFKQVRVGRYNKDFILFKFRSMEMGSDKEGLLTLGDKDDRMTKSGYFIRKYKLDELPQLFNVLLGNMSFVGPRPEVRKYVNYYTQEQLKVLNAKPGITDVASIAFRDEAELLKNKKDPENYYINIIMQEKLKMNLEYIDQKNIFKDISVIFRTLLVILK